MENVKIYDDLFLIINSDFQIFSYFRKNYKDTTYTFPLN